MEILRSAVEVFNTLAIALLIWYCMSRIIDRLLDISTKVIMLKIDKNNPYYAYFWENNRFPGKYVEVYDALLQGENDKIRYMKQGNRQSNRTVPMLQGRFSCFLKLSLSIYSPFSGRCKYFVLAYFGICIFFITLSTIRVSGGTISQ